MSNVTDATNGSIANQQAVLSNGLELAYYDSYAAGSGVPVNQAAVVLLHGYCGSSAYWDKIVPLLEPHFRVIAPDGRGHGRSEWTQDVTYTMELYAEDVAEMLDLLKINEPIVLGHSMGGYIALALAEAYSNKLAAFGLIHSIPSADSSTAKANRDKAVQDLAEHGIRSFVNGLVPKLFAAEGANEALLQLAREIGYCTSAEGAQAAARGMKAREDRQHVINNSVLPVLLVAGSKDRIATPELVFQASNANTVKAELAETSHMGMLETPEALAKIIIEFGEMVYKKKEQGQHE